MFAVFEKEVKETLGGDAYEDCLWLCDNGKINISQICEFAGLLDTRIPAILSSQSTSVQNSARQSFRCVMSEWYNFAAESEGTFMPFILSTLIEVFEDPNVRLFAVAKELKLERKLNSIVIRHSAPYNKPATYNAGDSSRSIPELGGEVVGLEYHRGAPNHLHLPSPIEGRFIEGGLSPTHVTYNVTHVTQVIDSDTGDSRISGRSSPWSINEEEQSAKSNQRRRIDYDNNSNLRKSQDIIYEAENQHEDASMKGDHDDSLFDSVVKDMQANENITIVTEFKNAIKYLKEQPEVSRCVNILERAVKKHLINLSQAVNYNADQGERTDSSCAKELLFNSTQESVLNHPKKQNLILTQVRSSNLQPTHGPNKKTENALQLPKETNQNKTQKSDHQLYNSKEIEPENRTNTPIQRKDINVIITAAQYITKKDIVVFSKIAAKLGVENSINMDKTAKKKPKEIMEVILRAWEQAQKKKQCTTTAEDLLEAMEDGTSSSKNTGHNDHFQRSKDYLMKRIEQFKVTGKVSDNEAERNTAKWNHRNKK